MKKTKIYIISIIALVVISALALTFAYFSLTIISPDSNNGLVIHAANFDTTFATNQYINVTNAMPINESDKEEKADHTDFTLTLLKDTGINYNVLLTNLNISDNLKIADFKWELLEDDNLIASGNFAGVGELTEMQLNNELLTLESGSKNYVFRLWISNTPDDQSDLLGGTFSGKIKIVSIES